MPAKTPSCVDKEDKSSDILQRPLRERHGISATDQDVEVLEMQVVFEGDEDEVDDVNTGAPNVNFRKISVRKTIFGTFVVKIIACLPVLGFSNT